MRGWRPALRTDGRAVRGPRPTEPPGRPRRALAPPGLARVPVSRDDVAMVLLGLLLDPRAEGALLELMGGETPIPEALEEALDQ